MPDQYLAIKRSLREQHPEWSERELEKHAARIFNSTPDGKRNPVGRHYEQRIKPDWKMK